jgi:hypothetical protein
MRSVFAISVVAASLGAGSAIAQDSEISLAWYDEWEATTFPSGSGGWDCSVDSLADNYADSDGAWVFVFPAYLQFAPNTGLPADGIGSVRVDNGMPIPMEIVEGQVGFVADEDDLRLLQALAQGSEMTIEVWSESAPNQIEEYVYSLEGFREGYERIASECAFDPSPVLSAAAPAPEPEQPTTTQEEPSEGSSLFGRDKHVRD